MLEEESDWEDLPDILLEDIFTLLEPRYRHEASQVCRRWYETFYAPRVWEHFMLKGNILTKRRYSIFKGYQRETCPRKTQICLHRVGYLFKKITITPIHDFQHVYEFIRILRAFLGYFDEFPMPLLHTFHFTFTCETRGITGVILHGTGGKMMEELRHLLQNMKLLKDLKLNNLMLDEVEVSGLFEAIANNCSDTIQTLEILNFTKVPHPILDVTLFDNLHTLRTSPQHLDDEVIVILASSGVSNLHIIQGRYTCNADPVSDDAWRLLKEMAPHFRVTLEVRGHTKTPLMLQPHAPVNRIVYDSSNLKFPHETAIWIVHYYHTLLESFVQKQIPRTHGPRTFHDRGDAAFLMLVRSCPKLHTLIISERICTATALVIAKTKPSLQKYIVRKNGLLKRCDGPKTDNFFRNADIRKTARSYEATNQQISEILGGRWILMSDRHFKKL
ncbi:uncharacterized protein LOC134228773 [Saccostrea cucullata]|uniref:uncharacterized protein LOC134228773 n=1 Tax=Saccostrea cuccullata TaxID=36930 RepID=UPI002ED43428